VDLSEEEAEAGLKDSARHHGEKTEELYKILQVSTCTLASVAHGSNDIANSIGPLAAVWMVFSSGQVSEKAKLPVWLLLYGAVALDIGLITYGHKIMHALGTKFIYHSPSRGFCIQLASMFTVLFFSKMGVPVSTTHCICGATAAVGVCGGGLGAVNWRMLLTMFLGWIVTVPAAGLLSGLSFLMIASAPRPMPSNGFFEL